MRMLYLLILACACSAPQRTEYHDGPMPRTAPTFVAPGFTPTGAGLPEYMPSHAVPRVERSPHRRELPPTRELGLWAGDQPRAAADAPPDWDTREPSVIGVPMPISDTAEVAEKLAHRQCSAAADMAVRSVLSDDQISSLRRVEAGCLARLTYHACLDLDAWRKRPKRNDGHLDARTEALLRRMDMGVSERAERLCAAGGFTPIISDAARRSDEAIETYMWWAK